jgi:tetratricopeptide (TPR) repeat protein
MKPYGMNGIPLEAQYVFRRGLEMVSCQNYEGALRYFRQAVFLSPRYSRAYLESGYCLARLHRYDESAECFLKAFRIDPPGTSFFMERNNFVYPVPGADRSKATPLFSVCS